MDENEVRAQTNSLNFAVLLKLDIIFESGISFVMLVYLLIFVKLIKSVELLKSCG
jgi:hypothetical protein